MRRTWESFKFVGVTLLLLLSLIGLSYASSGGSGDDVERWEFSYDDIASALNLALDFIESESLSVILDNEPFPDELIAHRMVGYAQSASLPSLEDIQNMKDFGPFEIVADWESVVGPAVASLVFDYILHQEAVREEITPPDANTIRESLNLLLEALDEADPDEVAAALPEGMDLSEHYESDETLAVVQFSWIVEEAKVQLIGGGHYPSLAEQRGWFELALQTAQVSVSSNSLAVTASNLHQYLEA